MTLYLILGIVFSALIILIMVGSAVNRRKKQKESELGIFHHPSNFKKPPVEWVKKSEDSSSDVTTKQL
jgi:hypothetical protein